MPGQPPQAAAPPPDVLYNNALRDYNAGKNDLAAQEFGDYVKYYPTTDLAGNSYYYLADMEYRQGNYQQAAKDYDQVLQNFPTGNKAAAAQLKKGFSLIELGQKNEGVSELRRVIQRYPRSSEALQARERLRKLGVSAGRTAPSAKLFLHQLLEKVVMRTLAAFVIVVFMSTLASAQALPAPQAITDPKQVTSKPNAQVEKSLTIEKLFMTRNVGSTTWSPDGKSIAFISNISGRNNLWVVPAGGGWPTQLTISDHRQSAPAWSPDGKWIAFQSDYDGDEQWDIFLVSPKTGMVVNLTNTRQIAELYPTWSPDGRYLAYQVKPKSSSVYEIHIYDTLMRETKHLTSNTPADKMNTGVIWSRDGKWIAYTEEQAKGTDSNLFMAELATGKNTLLTPHEGEQVYSANDLAPDGKKLLITSNAANGYENVGLLDIASKKIAWLTKDKWEINGGNFSPDGKEVTWTANVDGNTDIYTHNLMTGKTTALSLPKGVNSLGRLGFPIYCRRFADALLSQRTQRSQRCLGVRTRHREITPGDALAGRRYSRRGHGRAAPGSLSQPRRQVDHFCLPLRSLQHAQERAERRHRLRARRPDLADGELVQPLRPIRSQPGIHGAGAQLSRLQGLRQGISTGQSLRYGRRRLARRTRRR